MSEYLGLPPDGYQKPLLSASNLNDVPNKPVALANLGAASADDVLRAANPIGTIIAFYGSTAPYGYLPCNGQTVSSSTFPSLVTFLGGTTSATLPDMRGEFLRGWDSGRGIDVGRAIRTSQTDTLQNLTGTINASNGVQLGGNASGVFGGVNGLITVVTGAGGTGFVSASFDASRVARTSNETRPRNISVLYCIKAYDAPVSQGILNISQLVSDYSGQLPSKISYSDFTGANQNRSANGYQKLPGGMILQWGSVLVGANSTATATYPINFTSPPVNAHVSCAQSTLAGAGVPGFGCSASTVNQIVLQSTYTASPLLLYWSAVGF